MMKLVCTFALAFGLLLTATASAQGPGSPALGGVNLTAAAMANNQARAGEEVCFTLVARDVNGNIIRSWDNVGSPVTITIFNSTANTDTSTQSWSADPDDYSWAQFYHKGVPLTQLSATEWTISNTVFENGTAEVCLIHTKADTGVYWEITPKFPPLNQVSEIWDFTVGDVTNLLVELTPSVPGKMQVFHFRKYEIIVSPRDRFLNVSNEEVKAFFSARFPGEFVSASPGFSDIFSGAVFITGPTNYFLASTIIRELPQSAGQLQEIRVDGADISSITGQTGKYEILSHAPVPFALETPEDHSIWEVDSSHVRRQFTWSQPSPPDPYTNILISNITGEIGTDIVKYTWVCVDSTSLTRAQRLESNNSGLLPQLDLNNSQVRGIGHEIAGSENWEVLHIAWFVEATDGLYITKSSPPTADPQMRAGYYMTWKQGITGVEPVPATPKNTALYQNYPNPFNPSTNIRFEIVKGGPVSLKVYDLIGNEVQTLVDQNLPAGVYNASFDAAKLATGVYVYRLTTTNRTFTKRMVLSK